MQQGTLPSLCLQGKSAVQYLLTLLDFPVGTTRGIQSARDARAGWPRWWSGARYRPHTGGSPSMKGQTVSSVERRFGGGSAMPSSGCCCSLAPPSLSPAILPHLPA